MRLAALAVAVCISMLTGTAGAGDFYLRGSIGLDRPADTVFTDRDCSSTAPARVEVLVEYRPRFGFDGRANFLPPERMQSVAADLSSVSGMLAAPRRRSFRQAGRETVTALTFELDQSPGAGHETTLGCHVFGRVHIQIWIEV